FHSLLGHGALGLHGRRRDREYRDAPWIVIVVEHSTRPANTVSGDAVSGDGGVQPDGDYCAAAMRASRAYCLYCVTGPCPPLLPMSDPVATEIRLRRASRVPEVSLSARRRSEPACARSRCH